MPGFTDFSKLKKNKNFFKKTQKALDLFLHYVYIFFGSDLWVIFHEPILLPCVSSAGQFSPIFLKSIDKHNNLKTV